jgi:DNA-binding NarL/FixJ family response regulator
MPAGLLHGRKSDLTRIWMVDDNRSFRGLLANLLEEEIDFKCERQFASPPGVLEALATEQAPDIILLDVEMGEHNGLDAIRPIKALAPGTHVLMLTTFAGPGGRERAFREGASDFMLKTWETSEISAHIRQAREFGAVAGLMTAFLAGGAEVTMKPKEVEVAVSSSRAERWVSYLRSILKFSPS